MDQEQNNTPFKSTRENTVLIAVLRAPRDLKIAAQDHWYRIPLKKAPKNSFTHIAFYQPACFRSDGKRIVYYSEVTGGSIERRIDIFPDEPGHPAAMRLYLKYSLGPLIKLPTAILNTSASRISFGYAPLRRLARARDILAIFNVFPIENMMCGALRSAGVDFFREYNIMRRGKVKYRLDFALFCKNGQLDIECDGRRWHSTPRQRAKDLKRDKWLKQNGWTTLRFSEREVVTDIGTCVSKTHAAVESLGGGVRVRNCMDYRARRRHFL
jgi:very-short-patch-repair endonuclease